MLRDIKTNVRNVCYKITQKISELGWCSKQLITCFTIALFVYGCNNSLSHKIIRTNQGDSIYYDCSVKIDTPVYDGLTVGYFSKNNNKASEINYKQNKRHGLGTFYYPDGKIFGYTIYENDHEVYYKIRFNENGSYSHYDFIDMMGDIRLTVDYRNKVNYAGRFFYLIYDKEKGANKYIIHSALPPKTEAQFTVYLNGDSVHSVILPKNSQKYHGTHGVRTKKDSSSIEVVGKLFYSYSGKKIMEHRISMSNK